MHPLIYVPRRSLVIPDRAPRRLGCGCGMGIGSPSPWTPAAFSPSLWLGAYEEARGTKAAQPVIVDLSMDAADAAAWTASNATLAKSAVAPAQGTRWLEVTASAAYGSVYQNAVLIIGNRYAATGFGKGDGGAGTTNIGFGSGTSLPWSTASAAWQSCTAEGTAAGTTAFYGLAPKVGGSVVGFDGLAVVNLSLTSYLPRIGAAMTQATPAAMPWRGTYGITCQGGDLFSWSAGVTAAKCLHDGSGATLIVAVRPSSVAASYAVCTYSGSASMQTGIALGYDAGNLYFNVGNGTGALAFTGSAVTTFAINTVYILTLRISAGAGGIRIRQNSVQKLTGALSAPSVGDPTKALTIGTDGSYHVDGAIPDALLVPRVLTDAECLQAERDMYTRANNGVAPPW